MSINEDFDIEIESSEYVLNDADGNPTISPDIEIVSLVQGSMKNMMIKYTHKQLYIFGNILGISPEDIKITIESMGFDEAKINIVNGGKKKGSTSKKSDEAIEKARQKEEDKKKAQQEKLEKKEAKEREKEALAKAKQEKKNEKLRLAEEKKNKKGSKIKVGSDTEVVPKTEPVATKPKATPQTINGKTYYLFDGKIYDCYKDENNKAVKIEVGTYVDDEYTFNDESDEDDQSDEE